MRVAPPNGFPPCRLLVALLAGFCAAQQEPTGRIEGRVVDHLSHPLPVASVWAEVDGKEIARTVSDGSGEFVFGKLPLRTVNVYATADGKTIGMRASELDASQPSDLLYLRVLDATQVDGKVLGPDGQPMTGVHVVIQNDVSFGYRIAEYTSHAISDASGTFELDRAMLGASTIRAWAPGHQLLEQRVIAGNGENVTLRLQKATGAAFRLHLDGASKQQIAAADIVMRMSNEKGRGAILPKNLGFPTLDADGTALLDGLPQSWSVRVLSMRLPNATVSPGNAMFGLRRGENAPQHDVRFRVSDEPTLEITGHLRTAAGDPLVGRTIVCQRGWPIPTTTARTAADGSFRLTTHTSKSSVFLLMLERGEHILDAGSEDRARYRGRHVGRIGKPTGVKLTAIPTTKVRVMVIDERGRGVRRCVARLHPATNGSPLIAFTDARGVAVFDSINGRDDDEMIVSVTDIHGAGESEPFELQPGETIDIGQIQLARPACIEGTVRDDDGEAAPGARIALRYCDVNTGDMTGSGLVEVVADREGRFRFTGLEPRGWRLSLYPLGEAEEDVPGPFFELKAGETKKVTLRFE